MSGLIRKYIAGEGWQTVVDDGGGGSFNGGTITEPLAITLDPGDANPALNLTGGTGGGAIIMYAYDGNGLLGLTYGVGVGLQLAGRDDGSVIFQVGPTGAVTISPSEGGQTGLTITPAAAGNIGLRINEGGGSDPVLLAGLSNEFQSAVQIYGVEAAAHPLLEAFSFDGPVFTVTAKGGVIFPSSDPEVAGAWWDNAGTLTRSAG